MCKISKTTVYYYQILLESCHYMTEILPIRITRLSNQSLKPDLSVPNTVALCLFFTFGLAFLCYGMQYYMYEKFVKQNDDTV